MAVVIDTPVHPAGASRGCDLTLGNESTVEVAPSGSKSFLDAVLGGPKRYHHTSGAPLFVARQTAGVANEITYGIPTVSLGIQAIHQAYAHHVPLSLRPETLWFMIVHEVREYLRQYPRVGSELFVEDAEQTATTTVRDDSLVRGEPSDWTRSIGLLRESLRTRITHHAMDLFLPRFSTTTAEDETAMLVAMMDVVSPHHAFEWSTQCGIPRVRLEGEATDWFDLYVRAHRLLSSFSDLRSYSSNLLPVLREIADTASGEEFNHEFWRSIYQYRHTSEGSYATGWATAFFAYLRTKEGPKLRRQYDWHTLASGPSWGGIKTTHLPSHMCRVPFVWDCVGIRYDMAFAAGITGVDYDGTFLSPRLGFAVVEV